VLFESLIELINTADRREEPVHRGHCKRVPTLTMMLAEAGARPPRPARCRLPHVGEGPLRAQDRGPAARLRQDHDTRATWSTRPPSCQTIYDRIELVAPRFEVLKREPRSR
jgi:hypothetical protein